MENEDEVGWERRRSKIVLHVHAVWATKHRIAFLTPEWERNVYRCITEQVENQWCAVLALGGMPDHVHLVARLAGTVAPSAFMKQVKGHSSRFINVHKREFSEPFHWVDGFALFSLSHDHLANAIEYVVNQKQHHKNGTIKPYWEETDESAPM